MKQADTRIASDASRLLRRPWLIVFSLVVALGFLSISASDARATCGDYLGHHGFMSTNDLDGSHSPSNENRTPYRTPCHGPSCQQGPIHLPAPSPVVSFESQDRWMLALDLTLVGLDQASFLTRPSELVILSAPSVRLDRPPKI